MFCVDGRAFRDDGVRVSAIEGRELAGSPCTTELEGNAGGDLADFGVFDDAAAEFFYRGLEHGAAQVVAVNVEAGKWLEKAADGVDGGVELRESGGGLGVDEGGAPAVGFDHGDEIEFDLGFDLRPEHAAVGLSSLP